MHMSNVIKAFHDEGWHITFEYNWKGSQVHSYNPYIHTHKFFEPSAKEHNNKPRNYLKNRLQNIEKQYDKFVNFGGSLEGALIASEESSEYFWPLKMRRAKNANICYYDQSMKWAGFLGEKYMGRTGEVFFLREEHDHIKKQLNPFRKDFIILYCFRGTMQQKATYPLAQEVCNEFIRRHPETTIITTGDEGCQQWEWPHPKIIHKSGRMPFRQALLMSRYVDLVLTPETGLGIAAGVYGTPKIMLLTAASLKNIVGNDKNDFSLQSEAWCSPCTRAIYNTDNCPMNNGHPICVAFSKNKILDRMEQAYEMHYLRNWDAPPYAGSVYM